MLKSPQMAGKPKKALSPLSKALRDYIDAKGIKLIQISDTLNINSTTFNARLNGQNNLHFDSIGDIAFVENVVRAIDGDYNAIINSARGIELREEEKDAPDYDTVAVLLDTLENPQMGETSKKAARRVLLRLIGLEREN